MIDGTHPSSSEKDMEMERWTFKSDGTYIEDDPKYAVESLFKIFATR